MNFPKVLIFGQPFNDFSGGGITLSNLFKGWPKDKIAVTFIGHGLFNVTTDVCDTYYQLGREEHNWIFPLNLIQRKLVSGLKSFENKSLPAINLVHGGLRYKIVNRFFLPFLRRMGIYHAMSRISMSERFKVWLSEFKPEILYLQVSTREGLLFANDLCDYLKVPSVIHMMDDWPSTISSKGLFKNYWKRKIDNELNQLLSKVSLHLSISEAMSEEYKKRYNKEFVHFHNPIEVDNWLPYTRTDYSIDMQHIKVLCAGRIGDIGIFDSILEVAYCIDKMNEREANIKLHIQTPTRKKSVLDRLQKYKCVIINPFSDYKELPKIFSESDILLLANDFGKEGIDFLRFSMPTKASEYMISGTPILVYAPHESTVSRFFRNYNCGYTLTNQGEVEIMNAINLLLNDEDLRKRLSRNAVNVAKEKFNANLVRKDFQSMISGLV